MTKVLYSARENYIQLEIQGHAGFDEVGRDIVCAAISILSQSFVACMQEEAEESNYRIDNGYLWVEASGYKVPYCFMPILTGFRMLEDLYPDYIEIIEV